ncbi:MAG: hypothetical protein H8E80_07165 [Desulfobacteraceae bacterium]|uniref:Uncharacterized protein n=1 Tax=Candidatus Desulfaltia bathyphila TaxID=2841697 RepID=A0A8J6N5P2_9BACT|nr:hypothetical protein [Candidatus Desulfaltia bathyphila]MBL7195030.1 hypothetical protein [Desulfobacterales bacterium]
MLEYIDRALKVGEPVTSTAEYQSEKYYFTTKFTKNIKIKLQNLRVLRGLLKEGGI